eukprot:TRINITY_DN6489_c0_g1_i2.p1 TRINITY_DN6489_c0_g1~~TRINITY_DN6489_c0_g1_i2.p1  ORF type:complete len:347 (-),score=36.21 TRINITY_DN6489_c0_g1_i2:112-1098(-)
MEAAQDAALQYTQEFVSVLPRICAAVATLCIGGCFINCCRSGFKRWLLVVRVPNIHGNGKPSKLANDGDDEDQDHDVADPKRIDPLIVNFGTAALAIALKMFLAIVVAAMLGVQTTTFIAVVTALALAVGGASQNLIRDVINGLALIIFTPFKTGDFVELGSFDGWVLEVQLCNVIMRSPDNSVHIIPNHCIEQITNYSKFGSCRIDEPFVISNDENYLKVKNLLLQVANDVTTVLKHIPPEVLISKMNENGTECCVRAFVRPCDKLSFPFVIRERVKAAFVEHGIKIPRNAFADPPMSQLIPPSWGKTVHDRISLAGAPQHEDVLHM